MNSLLNVTGKYFRRTGSFGATDSRREPRGTAVEWLASVVMGRCRHAARAVVLGSESRQCVEFDRGDLVPHWVVLFVIRQNPLLLQLLDGSLGFCPCPRWRFGNRRVMSALPCGRLRSRARCPAASWWGVCWPLTIRAPGPLAIMPSADQVPFRSTHSTMRWHKWVVLIAGSTGSALRAVCPFQPSHHAGCPTRSQSRRERDRLLVALTSGHHGPGHPRDLVGKRDGGDLGRPPRQ